MLIYGDGGMGKTTLAKRLRDIALLEQPFQGEFQILWVDWEDERTRNIGLNVDHRHITPEVVFEVIHSAIIRNKLGAFFTDYQTTVKQLTQAEKQVAQALTSNNQYDDLIQLKGLGAGALASLVRSGVPAIGQTGEKLVETFLNAGIRVSVEQAARIRAMLDQRLRAVLSPEQYEVFLNPQEQLAMALARGVNKLSEKKTTIIFLDTYEIIDQVDIWMRLLIKNSGSKAFWVLSGRNDLSKSRRFGYKSSDYLRGYAEDFSNALILSEMRQLALDDMRIFFHDKAPNRSLNEEALSALSQATRGIPLAVSEAAEMWSKEVALSNIVGDTNEDTPASQIVQKMTDRYLIHAVTDVDKKALFALALARGNLEILNEMLRSNSDQSFDIDNELHRLEREYASVHYERAKLHEEPTLFLLEYLKNDKRRQSDSLKNLIQKALIVVRSRLNAFSKDAITIEEKCRNGDWVKAVLDLTDYLFWLDEREAWEWLIPRYVESLAYDSHLRQNLVRVAQSWEEHLSDDGKRRLNFLKKPEDGESDTIKAELELREELVKLAKLGWLNGEGKIEQTIIMNLWGGTLNHRLGKFDSALETFQHIYKTIKKNPGVSNGLKEQVSDAWATSAVLQVEEEKNYKDMVQTYRNIINFEPKDASAYHHLAHSLVQLRRFKQAIDAFQSAILIEPREPTHYDCLGQFFINRGQFKEAIDTYQKAIEIGKKRGFVSSIFHSKFNAFHQEENDLNQTSTIAKLYHVMAHAQGMAKNIEDSIMSFEEAIHLEPNESHYYSCLGDFFLENSRSDEAVSIFEQGIKVMPSNANLYHQLGHLLNNMANLDKAISSFQKAIELEPNDANHYSCLGQIFNEHEQFDKSEFVFQKAIELGVKNHLTYSGLALVRYFQNDYKTAYDLYKQSHELKPRAATLIGMAGTSRHLRKTKQVKEYLAQLKDFPATEYDLTCAESIKGNNKRAISHLKVAIKNDPKLKEWAKKDPDLSFIRDDPNFKALIEDKPARKKRAPKKSTVK